MGDVSTYSSLPDDQPILTVGHLRRLENAVVEAEAVAAEATARAQTMRGRLDKARQLIEDIGVELVATPAERQPIDAGPKKRRRLSRHVSHRSEISRALRRSPEGYLRYSELRAELMRGPLAERMNEKTFHNALARMQAAGELVRYKEHAFVPTAHKRFMAALERGEVEDVSPQGPARSSPLQDEFIAFVTSHARGRDLSGSEIIEGVIIAAPDVACSLRTSPTGGYNILKRLVERGLLVKDEARKTYRLADDGAAEQETGDSSSEDDPVAGEHRSLVNGSPSLKGLGL